MDLNVKVNLASVLNHRILTDGRQIHSTGFFLPWHRWYVAIVESAMKTKCGFTGAAPYWDWSLGKIPLNYLPFRPLIPCLNLNRFGRR